MVPVVLVFALNGAGSAAWSSRIPAGPARLDRYGRVATLRALFLLAGLGSILVVLGSAPVAFLGALLWGLGASLGFPVGMSAASDNPVLADCDGHHLGSQLGAPRNAEGSAQRKAVGERPAAGLRPVEQHRRHLAQGQAHRPGRHPQPGPTPNAAPAGNRPNGTGSRKTAANVPPVLQDPR